MREYLVLGTKEFESRLILGTGKYASLELMQKCHEKAGAQMVTVALRRVPLNSKNRKKSILDFIDSKITLLPNTAGAQTAIEALRICELANSLELKFLKLELIADNKTLLPDAIESCKALELIRRKYKKEEMYVMVYTSDDPIASRRLYEAGADCVMPAGSPIGSGRGIENTNNIKLIVSDLQDKCPVILDAGIGSAKDAVMAMELGVDAILLNSAIAYSKKPLIMAEAMKLACRAGRLSYLSGRMDKKLYATASSPEWEF